MMCKLQFKLTLGPKPSTLNFKLSTRIKKPRIKSRACVLKDYQVLFQSAVVRNCKSLASFLPSAGKNLTAISRFHTLTESMNRFPAAAVRLVCTFHNASFLPFCLKNEPGERPF